MRKKLAIGFALLFAAVLVAAVPLLTNPTPPSGSTIQGNSSTIFGIDGNETLVNGILLWDGVFKPSLLPDTKLNCTGTRCEAPYNLSSDTEAVHFYQFSVDGANSAVFTVTINRPPAQPTGCSADGYNETALRLNCSAGEPDILNYMIYRNNDTGVDTNNASQFIGNFTLSHIDGFLQTMQDYFYKVIAVDTIGQRSPVSAEFGGTVLDTTPPVPPIFIPPSPANFSNNTFQLNITYQENVSLFIYSGATLVDSFQCVFSCLWNKTLANGTYLFAFDAYDTAGNMRSDPWQVSINQNPNMTGNVTGLEFISYTVSAIRSSVLPGGYWLYNHTFTMYPYNCVKIAISDPTAPSYTIDVPSASQPIAFCAADYNPVTQDIIGSPLYPVVPVNNTLSTMNITCPDTSLSADTHYSSLLKIPVPLTATIDTYNWGVQFRAVNC